MHLCRIPELEGPGEHPASPLFAKRKNNEPSQDGRSVLFFALSSVDIQPVSVLDLDSEEVPLYVLS